MIYIKFSDCVRIVEEIDKEECEFCMGMWIEEEFWYVEMLFVKCGNFRIL